MSESRLVSVEIVFNDDHVLSKTQDARTRKNLSVEEVYEKFRDNARVVGLSEGKINHSVAFVKTLEEQEDITELIDLVGAPLDSGSQFS